MMSEVFDPLRGAVLVQILWRRAKKATVAHDAPCAQPAVGQLSESNRHVECAFNEIDGPVGDFKLDFDAGKPLRELGDERRNGRPAEPKRRVDTQKALRVPLRARNCFFHLSDLPNYLGSVPKIGLPLGRETDTTGRSIDQAHPKPLFNYAQSLCRSRWGQIKFASSAGQTSESCQKDEELEVSRSLRFGIHRM